MLAKLRNYIGEFRAYNRERAQVVQALEIKEELLMARIVRFVHAIEKGLSIESPRAEFGYEKIKTLHRWIREYLKIDNVDKTCVYMAADALTAYLAYHEAIGVNSEKIKEIAAIASEFKRVKEQDGVDGVFGGVQIVKKVDMTFEQSTVERLFKTRHSVRKFNKETVPEALIEKAIELAQTAPSACNRQAVRAYAMDAKRFVELYSANLQGVGGFIDTCDKVILITGKISAYEQYEYKQFIVSAGIFAGYLSLALHGLGLGACVVQRSLRPDQIWQDFSRKANISLDEQVVCLVTVGQMDEETVVPISKRFDTETILKWLR